jgi:hypothetical protein
MTQPKGLLVTQNAKEEIKFSEVVLAIKKAESEMRRKLIAIVCKLQ